MTRIRTSTKCKEGAMGTSRQEAPHRNREEGENEEEENVFDEDHEDSQRQPDELDVSAAEIIRNPWLLESIY